MQDIAWTFGVITAYEDKNRLNEILDSIRTLGIPEYEILLVGGGDFHGESPLIGLWARDIISIEKEQPLDYEELIFDLKE